MYAYLGHLQDMGSQNAINHHCNVKIVTAWPSAISSSMNRVCFEEGILTKISKLEN